MTRSSWWMSVLLGAAFVMTAHSSVRAAEPIRLELDASDAGRSLFHGRLHIPVQSGAVTLVYPKWIPGEHGPTGPITDFGGLVVSGGGKTLAWKRDGADMYAFHIDVPQGVSALDVSFDQFGATSKEGFSSASSSTPNLAIIAWNQFLLYPEGANSDDVAFAASITLPDGWQCATALTTKTHSGSRHDFEPVSLTMLVDSPVLMGRYFRVVPLDNSARPVEWDIAADSPEALAVAPASEAAMKGLVREADALYGARHYNHYNFLFTLSDHVAHFGLEHHQCNDTRLAERTLIDEKLRPALEVLAHEYMHSWNAKYRRPTGLATPNYQVPMDGNLLWIYEGLTQYLGCLLSARSGIWTPEYYREMLAYNAAYLDHSRGRDWRPLQDTADAAQLLYEAPDAWAMARRGTDFYDEGWMLWLDVDTRIREMSKGKKSLDDFCRVFHGGKSGPPELKTYTLDDVVATLNTIEPYDWRSYFAQHVTAATQHPPFDGITRGGWKLVYNDKKNDYEELREGAEWKRIDASYSIGIRVKDDDGSIIDVTPDLPAWKAGVGPGMTLVAVNSRKYSSAVLKDAIAATKTSKQAMTLLVENRDFFNTYTLDYHDGTRNPHLEKSGSTDMLSRMLAAHRK
ncbi:MAG TPA: M61 family peptidase [Candidatus Krumholzibacteria bacterium]|nr:M61 family peptidase [Candidatus Krumholzibacteria bacterium]